MQFGSFFLAGSPSREDSSVVMKRLLRFVQDSEELGYDSVWFAEHHFSNYGYIPNPLIMSAHMAKETERIRLGTAVLVLPFWNPLRVAEDIALTDQLTGGRLEVGVARGYQPFEFRRFGLSHDDARERTDEVLTILLKALTSESFSFQGRYHEIPEVTVFPRSAQTPHPPLWLAAHTQESFEVAARHGLRAFTTNSGRPVENLKEAWDNYLAARAKHPSAPEDFGVQVQVIVADTDEEARQQMGAFLYQTRQVATLRSGHEHVVSGVSEPMPFEGEPTVDEMFDLRTISGSPETVIKKIEAYRAVAPMSLLNCVFHGGDMPAEVARHSMRLFAQEVMPHFR
jgi:alkanesulfonate monooxygenase SsuD/methylene tetrahydromethanopterin reductase-like flavin-dependent oxidoreductase (luciferase family)